MIGQAGYWQIVRETTYVGWLDGPPNYRLHGAAGETVSLPGGTPEDLDALRDFLNARPRYRA